MSTEPDIIERLESIGCDREPFTDDHKYCQCRTAWDAAREIERLRYALEVSIKASARNAVDVNNELKKLNENLLAKQEPLGADFTAAVGDVEDPYEA